MAAEGAKIMGLRMTRAQGSNFKGHTCSKLLEVPKCQTKMEMENAVIIALNYVKSGYAILED